jgi:NTE family protein
LAEVLTDKTFADLKIPATLMAVDMRYGREVELNEGPLLPAVLATSAVPAIFPPVEVGEMLLTDGGVLDSLASHVAFEQLADIVVAVDIEPPLDPDNPWVDPISAITGFNLPLLFGSNDSAGPPNMFAAMWRAVRVMAWHIHAERLNAHPPDVLLRPDVAKYGSLDFKELEGPLRAGAVEAERHVGKLKALTATT